MDKYLKVESHHLERAAYLYVRQSSMRQVLENTESTKRQYALRQRAIALGWREDRIIVIDSDQGESGASASWREGFQRLVTEVGMGHAGIVMGLEVSRLARNNADWHRLLEICALSQTLILDEDGVYDPAFYNDRMLLGLKGTMSEAELHVLKARLRGGILNKARRGELRCQLPTGLVYDETGNVTLDPDSQIRETLIYFFETFARERSASQTTKVFQKENLLFPSKQRCNGHEQIEFQKLTVAAAMRTLHNPRYAGVYAYGRRSYRRTIKGDIIREKQDCNDWIACIPDAHPGYITWEEYQQNLRILQKNAQGYEAGRNAAPREGCALLQGRAICGICGQKFRMRYRDSRGKNEAWYICDRPSSFYATPHCQTIAATPVDQAINQLVVRKMTPAAIELAIAVRQEIEVRQDEADRLRMQVVERAKQEADLAERRYMMVDPSNRLVADSLEADWNNKLRTLAEAREERERKKQQDIQALDETIRKRLLDMTEDFNRLWTDPATSHRDRKRILAHIIEDVILVKFNNARQTEVRVRFKGGKTESLIVDNPISSPERLRTPPETIQLVDQLLNDYTYKEIAHRLNELGIKPTGSPNSKKAPLFDSRRIEHIVHTYHLKSRYERLRERGMLSADEIAERLNIHLLTLDSWRKHGLVKRHAYTGYRYLYEIPDSSLPPKKRSRWNLIADRAASMHRNIEQNQNPKLKQ